MRLSPYLTAMAVFLLAVTGIAVWLLARLESAFLANPLLNLVLLAVWLFGVGYIIAQAIGLYPEIKWVQAVRRNRLAVSELEPPPLMGSLARLMEDRTKPFQLTPTALRAVLDGIAVRLDEKREIARYFIGLMIFLGLLGTFWGLLQTVSAVGGVVNGLSVTADPTELFSTLKAGLQGPLNGMGTAFGSSLLGLAGSLVLGFLDLQLGQAQNAFFIGLEDWLFATASGSERVPGEGATPLATVQALVEQTATAIDGLRRALETAESERRLTSDASYALIERISGLIDAHNRDIGVLKTIEAGITRIADSQEETRALALEEVRSDITRLARTIGVKVESARDT